MLPVALIDRRFTRCCIKKANLHTWSIYRGILTISAYVGILAWFIYSYIYDCSYYGNFAYDALLYNLVSLATIFSPRLLKEIFKSLYKKM